MPQFVPTLRSAVWPQTGGGMDLRKAVHTPPPGPSHPMERHSPTKATYQQKKKVGKVLHEFKEGALKSSTGRKVTDRAQAEAIALSEAGLSKKTRKRRG